MFIYCITNKINNKKYVGLTTRSIKIRFYYHKYLAENNMGYYLHNAMRKYGIENFKIEKLDTAKSIEELKEKEIKYIKKLDTFRNGYNLTEGGDYSSNKGFTTAFIDGKIVQVSVEDFKKFNLKHPNKNKITIIKDNIKKRIDNSELSTYESSGWVTINKNLTSVILQDGTKTKIPAKDFNPEIHKGIRKGLQNYYNPITGKIEGLLPEFADPNFYYNKNKIKYKIYNNKGKCILTILNIEKIPINIGGSIFMYMYKRNKDNDKFIITEEVLNKLKPKSRNFNLINYRLEVLKI